jgi:hypothetical protein
MLYSGHDLDVCEDFVTEENREEAAGLIEKDGESVPSCINKLIISGNEFVNAEYFIHSYKFRKNNT